MSTAKAYKMKEYGTDVLSHPDYNVVSPCKTRESNSIKSQVFAQNAGNEGQRACSKERFHPQRPLTAHIMRTSFQDSNIFGYKNDGDLTVQPKEFEVGKQSRVRQNNTFKSSALPSSNEEKISERPKSRARNEGMWQSKVFAGPVDTPSTRKRLNYNDKDIQTLFGDQQIDYQNTSNSIPILGQKKQTKAYPPPKKSAEQRKNDDLYGRSAQMCSPKKDSGLSASCTDWKNPNQQHVNGPKRQDNNSKSRDRKYYDLATTMPFGDNDYSERVEYNNQNERFIQEPKQINKGCKQDAYKKRQAELTSSVLEQTDYTAYAPMRKKSPNPRHMEEKTRRCDHMFSSILGSPSAAKASKTPGRKPAKDLVGASNSWQNSGPQQKKSYGKYTAKKEKHNEMISSLDTHAFRAALKKEEKPVEKEGMSPEKARAIGGKQTRANKVHELQSNIFGTGDASNQLTKTQPKGEVVDIDLKGLPERVSERDIKEATGCKHVISTSIDVDNLRNVCKGTGRVKVRLGADDTVDMVKVRLMKEGYGIQDHQENPKKKTGFTEEAYLRTKQSNAGSPDKGGAKYSKVHNLSSSIPETFGNSGNYQQEFKHGELNGLNKAKQIQNQDIKAMNSWTQVSRGK